jgi:hypothetical protein
MRALIALGWGLIAACGRYHYDPTDQAAVDGAAAVVDGAVVDADPAAELPANTVVAIEAEEGAVVAPFLIRSDPAASNGSYVFDDHFESGWQSTGLVTYQVSIPATADYLIWARSRSPDTESDSFLFSIDGDTAAEFHTAFPNTSDPEWHWTPASEVLAPFPPRTFPLTAGMHTLVFSSRETWSTLDRLAIALP